MAGDCTVNWDGGALTTSWHDAANWAPDGVPGSGDVVCILEAMKMESAIPAPREGVVSELPVQAGQVVQVGQTLAVID